jgi:hypothetical protein
MTQPHLLQNLCATAALYSSNTEIHRHIARCFANFALYGEPLSTIIHIFDMFWNLPLHRHQSQEYASSGKQEKERDL